MKTYDNQEGSLLLGRDQTRTDGVAHQPRNIMDAEPFHQLRTVCFDGFRAQLQDVRYVFRRVTFCKELQNFSLAGG